MTEPQEPDEAEDNIELVMPFVTVATQGGPHDDASYAAGWEMGALDAQLAHEAPKEWGHPIHRTNAAQADLVAMKHGYAATMTELADGWTMLKLIRSSP